MTKSKYPNVKNIKAKDLKDWYEICKDFKYQY